ncbi:MAG: ABC transporter ATP-binding protein [Bacteroidetes bacterium]|nr:MAG: ABC transporter ATP-binding protein [Bacteroidota bacterium]
MIHVRQLSFSYPGAAEKALKNVSFDIESGEIFGFLGPSGAGKTTTQKILYKILHGYEGEVRIGQKPLQDWDQSYFERIGVGFELPNHYLKLTARENLQLFGSFYPPGRLRRLEELFELVGLEAHIDQRVETYSKGMKMRLNFIRAIMHDPQILFFDEPTAGLDPINARKILDHIRQLKTAGKTIFITTHNMYTADELCDQVAFIVEGELRLTDAPAHLKQTYGKNQVMVELQQGAQQTFPLEGLGQNEAFLAFIRQDELKRIHTLEASLEEVFIRVTGQTLLA